MSIIEKTEWSKLHIAKYKDWTISLCGDQHIIGWLSIFPPTPIENSIAHLSDKEILEFKEIGLLCEDILKKAFKANWFNYSQAGNVTKRIHIHIIPRYKNPVKFNNMSFKDEGWGGSIKYLPYEDLPKKETVFEIVNYLKSLLKQLKLKNIEIVE